MKAAKHPHVDQAGLDWQAEADRRWGRHLHHGEPYEAPPLQDFEQHRPGPHVTREIQGAYILDAAYTTVHRVATATLDCHIDGITPALYVHHWQEVVAIAPQAECCPLCLPARG